MTDRRHAVCNDAVSLCFWATPPRSNQQIALTSVRRARSNAELNIFLPFRSQLAVSRRLALSLGDAPRSNQKSLQ